MSDATKPSKYLLDTEHITDREIDELYNLSSELALQLDRFRNYDKDYRALEGKNDKDAEAKRADILSSCALMMEKVIEMLKESQEISKAISINLVKAKAALEEKLEQEK